MNQVKLNVDEMKIFIKHMVNNNKHIQETGKVPVAVNIEGEAGLGKTSAIMQLGSELEMQVVKLNLAQLEELGFRYVLDDLHQATWMEPDKKPPFTMCSTDKYIVTVFAWQGECV